jgi:chromate transporter
MENRLLGLFVVFVPLSLLSFGGGQAIVADMQHQMVDVHGYLSNQQFSDLFAVSRAAPGPSTLIVALIGYQIAGFWGALLSCVAIFLPSSLLVYGIASWWQRHRTSPLKIAVERGLAPVAVGLIFAGALAVIRAAHVGPLELATLVACCGLFYFTKVGSYTIVLSVAAVFFAVHLLV